MTSKDEAEKVFKFGVAHAAGAMAIERILTPATTFKNYEPSPYIHCLSFSIELFLKALLKLEGKSLKDHSYLKLLERLSDECRKELHACYQAERNEGMCTEQFKKELESISNAYEKWRYAFETDNLSTHMGWFLATANASMKVSLHKQPHWKIYLPLIARARCS